jgi:16S rRNA (cytosine1402-N4)-methyltransferase
MSSIHKSVLLNEVIKNLDLKPGNHAIDCTFGGGGHSRELLKAIKPGGKLLALDADKKTGYWLDENSVWKKDLILVNDNFRNLEKITNKYFLYPVSGILLDLGLSSDQLESSGRGFTFQKDEPLDMRFNEQGELTAADILNSYSLENLIYVFKNYGEFQGAEKLAKEIINFRRKKKFATTLDLVSVVIAAGVRERSFKINPATQVFQALRLEVNDELGALREVLPAALKILAPGGRLAVISFHALEDRIVKNIFRNWYKAKTVKLLTKKPLVPGREEIKHNPRSRSAKLRVIEKI